MAAQKEAQSSRKVTGFPSVYLIMLIVAFFAGCEYTWEYMIYVKTGKCIMLLKVSHLCACVYVRVCLCVCLYVYTQSIKSTKSVFQVKYTYFKGQSLLLIKRCYLFS